MNRLMNNVLRYFYHKYCWIREISVSKYIYYNWFSKKVVKESNVYLIPYKGAILQLDRGSKLFLKGKNLEIGVNKIKGSKVETYIRLKSEAIWNCNNGGMLCYDSCIEVHEKGRLTSGFFYMNTRSTLIATKAITLGEDVWMGRSITIYDSDFHQMQNEDGSIRNLQQEVRIGNHVWLTNQVMVQKGVTIGEGAVISPYTVLRSNVQQHTLVANGL